MTDPGHLLESVRHLPDRVRDAAVAAADVEGLPDREGIRAVVIFGVGVARVAGDVLESISELTGTVPVVATGARCPPWVGPDVLAVAVSLSGEDAATIGAAAGAREAGARLVVVTSGGELGDRGSDWGAPAVRADPETGPLAALGAAIVPVLVVLERLSLVSGMSRIISGAAEQLDARRRQLDEDSSLVDAIAAELPDRVAVVCGAGSIGKHAARRWVQQLDRVGHVAAVRRRLPVDAEDVATWVRLAEQVSGGLVAVVLRHDHEPEGLAGGLHLLDGAVDALQVVGA
ncbi:MAG: hypothetical protein ACE5GB_01325, partial [Acidimicrobiales bacterium]